jgi:hypothetical protein
MFNITQEPLYWYLAYLTKAVANALTITDVAYQRGYATGYATAQVASLKDQELDRYFKLVDNVARQRMMQLMEAEY